MNIKGANRSVRKTKARLREGLCRLLELKPANNITVKELSDMVDLNRGTFYLYYRDIYDMIEKIENEMFEQLGIILSSHNARELGGNPEVMLTEVFQYLYENADMGTVLISQNGNSSFISKLKDTIRSQCFNDWAELFVAEHSSNFEYYYSFIVAGCIGLFQKWLEDGMRRTPQEMGTLAKEMILNGMQMLKTAEA